MCELQYVQLGTTVLAAAVDVITVVARIRLSVELLCVTEMEDA